MTTPKLKAKFITLEVETTLTNDEAEDALAWNQRWIAPAYRRTIRVRTAACRNVEPVKEPKAEAPPD